MRAMSSDSRIQIGLGAALAGVATVAAAQVPQPPINGVVVEDVTRPFVFDRIGVDSETGPFVGKDAYQGTVRSMVIAAPDDTFDFLFRITATSGLIKTFSFRWQVPTSYTVAYHVTDPVLLFEPAGASRPAPGFSASDALSLNGFWTDVPELDNGRLSEGVLLLDTDAKAYAATGSYMLGDDINVIRGSFSGQSPTFTTFGPAIPEPETYALMLAGLGLLALGRRVRPRQ